MRSKLAPSFLALALILGVAPEAGAQPGEDVAQARELFLEGAKLAESGSWAAARERFERSLKLKRAALTLYNLGVAQQETGHLVDAIESYRAFLAQPVEPATQSYVAPVRAELAKLEKRVGYVEVDVRPENLPGVVVRIDGRQVAPAPGARMVDPGRHEVVATAPGYGTVRQKTTVDEGGRVTLVLTLPEGPPALATGLVLGGLAAFLAGEIVFGVGAADGIGSPGNTGSARAAMIAGNVVAGAGVIATGVGAYLLLRRPSVRAPEVAVAPWVSAGVVGVQGRF